MIAAIECQRCKAFGPPAVSWLKMVNGKYHLKAECASCGSYIKWLKQTPELIEIAGPKP